jgi:ferredoxin
MQVSPWGRWRLTAACIAVTWIQMAECFLLGGCLQSPRGQMHAAVASSSRSSQLRLCMAVGQDAKKRRPQNVEGNFFVDHTCINCDTCRWMAPETFDFADGMSAVTKQPTPGSKEYDSALAAMSACPTGSIRAESPPEGMSDVISSFPRLMTTSPDVYHCGFHDAKSFGAASYIVVRPAGNVLVDAPRYNSALARRIEALGAPMEMLITHSHDCADHHLWKERFPGMERVVHAREVGGYGADRPLSECERQLDGPGPWELRGGGAVVHQPVRHPAPRAPHPPPRHGAAARGRRTRPCGLMLRCAGAHAGRALPDVEGGGTDGRPPRRYAPRRAPRRVAALRGRLGFAGAARLRAEALRREARQGACCGWARAHATWAQQTEAPRARWSRWRRRRRCSLGGISGRCSPGMGARWCWKVRRRWRHKRHFVSHGCASSSCTRARRGAVCVCVAGCELRIESIDTSRYTAAAPRHARAA